MAPCNQPSQSTDGGGGDGGGGGGGGGGDGGGTGVLIGDNLQFLEEAVMASAWFRPVLAHRGQLVLIHCKETGETGGSYPLQGDR